MPNSPRSPQRALEDLKRISRPAVPPGAIPPICHDVQRWANARGLPCETLRAGGPLERRAPRSIEPDLPKEFRLKQHQELLPKYLAILPQATLVGWRGVIRLDDGSFPSEVIYGYDSSLREEWGFASPLPGLVEKAEGAVYLLSFPWWKNYAHWHRDVLCPLYDVLPRLPSDIQFAVPERLFPYQKETLRALGLSEERLMLLTSRSSVQVKQLYFTPHMTDADGGWCWLRERLLAYYQIPPARGTRRLFISRRNAVGRRIVNEPEVVACLAEYGFETVQCEELSYREQVALFAQAEIVVGSHGAGLTNVLFAPAGTRVLDILTPAYVDGFFWEMCEALNSIYFYVLGDAVADSQNRRGRFADVSIPVPKIKVALAQVLDAP